VNSLPFAKPGQFYRGNLHAHSTRSDGGRTPDQVLTDYQSRGYDFISLTDHFLPNDHFRKGEPGFITVSNTRDFEMDGFVTILGATCKRSSNAEQTAVELPLPDRAKTPYVRVTVVDDAGNAAWSNPIWLEG
jgi:hypothetical protein